MLYYFFWRQLLLLVLFRFVSWVNTSGRRCLLIPLNKSSATYLRVQAHIDRFCFFKKLLFAKVLWFLRSLSSWWRAISRNTSLTRSGTSPSRQWWIIPITRSSTKRGFPSNKCGSSWLRFRILILLGILPCRDHRRGRVFEAELYFASVAALRSRTLISWAWSFLAQFEHLYLALLATLYFLIKQTKFLICILEKDIGSWPSCRVWLDFKAWLRLFCARNFNASL